jgi:hypothetical protein
VEYLDNIEITEQKLAKFLELKKHLTNIVYWYILILLITALKERDDMIRNSLSIYRKRAGMTQFEVAKKLDTKQIYC